MNSIVVYFSYSGNTRIWAEKTASLTGSDIAEIRACTDFPEDPEEMESFVNSRMNGGGEVKAPIRPVDLPIDSYGVVIIASPIWNTKIPHEVKTFLSSVDWRGRKVFVLVTYGGALGDHLTDVRTLCEGASFGRNCAVRPAYPEDLSIVRSDNKRYEEWIREIRRFLGS